jgi:ferric-dicitrate binding protein FerR (iron transport regulator)
MMDKSESINIIEQALNAAFLKGVYNISDADKIIQALKALSGSE